MIAYRFLQEGATDRFRGGTWPVPDGEPGAWVETSPPDSIHAYGGDSLVDWIDDELWEVELADPVTETDGVRVAQRARLTRRLTEWDELAARALGEWCVARARTLAIGGLERAGMLEQAEQLARADSPHGLRTAALDVRGVADDEVGLALAYVRDVVSLSLGGRPDACGDSVSHSASAAAIASNLAFVTAVAAGAVAAKRADDAETFAAAFETERAAQRAWLGDRLAGASGDESNEAPLAGLQHRARER